MVKKCTHLLILALSQKVNGHMAHLRGWARTSLNRALNPSSVHLKKYQPFVCIYRTSGFIVRFLPVKNDKRRAALHSNHSKVGGRYAWRTSHILITALLIREVGEGGGDRARLIWFLIRLVDHMGSWRQIQTSIHLFIYASYLFYTLLFIHAVVPNSVARALMISTMKHLNLLWRCKTAMMKSYLQSASCPWYLNPT